MDSWESFCDSCCAFHIIHCQNCAARHCVNVCTVQLCTYILQLTTWWKLSEKYCPSVCNDILSNLVLPHIPISLNYVVTVITITVKSALSVLYHIVLVNVQFYWLTLKIHQLLTREACRNYTLARSKTTQAGLQNGCVQNMCEFLTYKGALGMHYQQCHGSTTAEPLYFNQEGEGLITGFVFLTPC